MQQQRHPAIEGPPVERELSSQAEALDPDRDEGDLAADQRAMDRVRTSLVRGHALNQAQTQDLLPGL